MKKYGVLFHALLITAAASASLYIAWIAALLLTEQAPRLLLAAAAAVQVEGFSATAVSPGWVFRLPPGASASLHVLFRSAEPLVGLAILLIGPALVRRLDGWPRIWSAQILCCIALRVTLHAAQISFSSAGLLLFLQPHAHAPWSTAFPVRITAAALLVAAVLFGLYHAFAVLLRQGSRIHRLQDFGQWLVLPALLAAAAFTVLYLPYERASSWLPSLTVLGILLLSGLPAAARARSLPGRLIPKSWPAVSALLTFLLLAASLQEYTALHMQSNGDDPLAAGFAPPHTTKHAVLHLERSLLGDQAIGLWARHIDEQLARIASRLTAPLRNPRLTFFLYRSSTLKGSRTGSDLPLTLQPDLDTIHELVTPAGAPADARAAARLLMHHSWGAPASERVADALSRYAIGDFYGNTLPDYAARIALEEQPYSLREIFALDKRFLSPLVRDALSGAWVRLVVDRYGDSCLPLLYHQPLDAGKEDAFARSLGTTWEAMEQLWQTYLGQVSQRLPNARRELPAGPVFQRGMTLTSQGRRMGYGTDSAERQLLLLRDLGVNAVTLVPYAGTGAPEDVEISVYSRQSDLRLARTIASARQAGLQVVLKPQLRSRSRFIGDVAFDDPRKFEQWFANYRRWILHCARLAELCRVDLLVIGTELAGMTGQEQAWRALIRDLRRVYAGPMTYAAHWGKDFEGVRFWDELDYIGLNMYYPLAGPAEQPRADSARIRELQNKIAAISRRYKRKIVFTEVGFSNTSLAAAEPWAKGNRLDYGLQRLCYQALFDAFFDAPWLAGMHPWEWPTHGEESPYYPTFSLIGKPPVDVIRSYYRRPRIR